MHRAARGFTLIELMIVVAIVGILVGIALPRLVDYRARAFDTAAATGAKNLITFQTAFSLEYNEYAPLTTADQNASGAIDANITLNDGSVVKFTMIATSDMQLICNVSPSHAYANIGVKHLGGTMMVGADLDHSGMRKKLMTGPIHNSDLPDASSSDDLSGWSMY